MASQPPQTLRLPMPRASRPRTPVTRFLASGGRMDESRVGERKHPWYMVIWLTGVDYFSTLGYQPGIALLAAGALSVPATGVLVLVTLFGAVPVYAEVARRSYAGQGSIAMLENLLSGWSSKIFVLVLLGFAATDFVITMTLSAADAARHAVENPYLHPLIGDRHMGITLALLLVLAAVFLMGFREAIRVAALVAVPYLLLNLVVLLRGLWVIGGHPALIQNWRLALHSHGDWTAVFIASAIVFPKLALGLSGFETGVSVMPLVDGGAEDKAGEGGAQLPRGRIHATRKLLVSAAVIMSAMLILSGFVAALLIPPSAYQLNGPASGRAIAYLAHRMLGNVFGSIYDFSTILILWFAGASAMAGLLNLIPRYLPRFGMAPNWVAYRRPLVVTLLAVDVVVTLVFRASVEAQGDAYATGVLALILSAAIAVALALGRESLQTGKGAKTRTLSLYFWGVTLVFAYTFIANVFERPDGIIIASIFIFLLLSSSALSRYRRSTEMRVSEVVFADEPSARLWQEIAGKKVNLIPHHAADKEARQALAAKVRGHFKIQGPLAFLHVDLMDNRSEFNYPLRVRVLKDGDTYLIYAWNAVAIANAIAYLSELLEPISITLGLTRRNLMQQSLAYALWGEGEVGLLVYSVLVRYWEFAKPIERPLVYLMSE